MAFRIPAALVAGAVVVRLASRACRGGFDVEQMVERMPDGAPPKWMFRNIGAIRANTERILELLETERAAEVREHAEATV